MRREGDSDGGVVFRHRMHLAGQGDDSAFHVDADVPGFSLGQAGRSWADSLIFDPRALLVLLPLAVLGAFALRPWVAALLVAGPATNAVFYTFYEHTHLHPRFLYAALPALFVLQAAGAALLLGRVVRRD